MACDWWCVGNFAWEEGTPPVHLRTPLVVRSHEVISTHPAIQSVSQLTANLSVTDPLEWCVLRWHLVVYVRITTRTLLPVCLR